MPRAVSPPTLALALALALVRREHALQPLFGPAAARHRAATRTPVVAPGCPPRGSPEPAPARGTPASPGGDRRAHAVPNTAPTVAPARRPPPRRALGYLAPKACRVLSHSHQSPRPRPLRSTPHAEAPRQWRPESPLAAARVHSAQTPPARARCCPTQRPKRATPPETQPPTPHLEIHQLPGSSWLREPYALGACSSFPRPPRPFKPAPKKGRISTGGLNEKASKGNKLFGGLR